MRYGLDTKAQSSLSLSLSFSYFFVPYIFLYFLFLHSLVFSLSRSWLRALLLMNAQKKITF